MFYGSLHLPHYHIARMGDIKRAMWAHSIGLAGSGLVKVFVPIFLLKIGYSLDAVLVFLVLQGVFSLALMPLSAWLMGLVRPGRLMAVGLVANAIYLLLLLSLTAVGWPLWLVAAGYALHIAIYSPAFHLKFSVSRAHEKTGRQVSGIQIAKIISTATAPAVGGVLADLVGINFVYGVAVTLQLMAMVPLFLGKGTVLPKRPDFSRLNWRRLRWEFVANMANGQTTTAEVIIWPILVSLLVTGYAGIGLLTSIIALASVAAALYVGRRQEKVGERHYLKEGTFLAGVSDIFRLLASSPLHVFGINFLGGVGNSLYFTPFMSKFYADSDKHPTREYIIFMDSAWHVGWTLCFLVLLLLSAFLPDKTTLLVGIALAIPGNYLINRILRA